MALYGSRAWLDEVQTRLNADPQMATSAKNLKADFQYVIEADDKLDTTIECGWRIDSGTCSEVWDGMQDADFVMVGPYSVFKRVNLGEVSATEVMMSGELQVQGNQADMMANFAAIGAMQAVLEKMAAEGVTEWPA